MGAGTPIPSAFKGAYDAARAGLLAQLEPRPPAPSRPVMPVVAAATPAGHD